MSVKRKLLTATGAIAAGMVATPAFAQGYWGGFIGAASLEDVDVPGVELDYDTGFVIGGVLGARMSDNMRIEGELSWLNADADCSGKCPAASFDTDVLSLLGNVWFDFGNGGGFSPYVGGGIGIAQVTVEGGGVEADESGFAYQVGVGARFGATGAWDIGYRYRGVEVDSDDFGGDIESNAHMIQLGWRGNFY